jgi:imidazolonepropionase-like amidohydrolase
MLLASGGKVSSLELLPGRRSAWLVLLGVLCACAQEAPVAFTGARLIPVAGPEIADGVLVVQSGKIVSVGRAGTVAIPPAAKRIDLAGKVVMPGLIDTHSHVGDMDSGDSSSTIQPDVRVYDEFEPRSPYLLKVLAGGVTTINALPGSGLLLSGQTVYLKLRGGSSVDDLVFRTADGRIAGGMKMANGENPRRPTPPAPGTRAKAAALVREAFLRAQDYRDKVNQAKGDASKLPPRDLYLEGLVEVLDHKRIVHFHTHRADDILTALRLAREFNFRIVLHHVSDGWKVAKEIAASGAPCSLYAADAPGSKVEARDMTYETGGILEKLGVPVAFHTDDTGNYTGTDNTYLLRMAALGVRFGMSREKALEALTLAGARMLDLQDRIGSLEPGKDADFIVLSGDPFSVYTHILETWVEGRKLFDRSDPKQRIYSTGGYGSMEGPGIPAAGQGEED